ncbi:hypothetical protein CYR55_10980 [Chimaeribacter californicus]|uniref:Uncharacterized protein n=1 Tax=Chimaeribacter californicus TaxID=2060067 RepID=A0A2N5E5Z0_9GAMM|nr:hypothetical protein [Chimaeribacter californicus]PLR36726.1 hypothetical protein CYR55_10980 [Chimaeribacter californicus]
MSVKRVPRESGDKPWLHGLTTLVLLIVVVGFLLLNRTADYKADDVFYVSRQVTPELWLYATRNDSGNATVPVVYRYYLSSKITGSEDEVVDALHSQIPFLEGTGDISAISAENNRVRIVYSGRVYSLDESAHYTVNGETVTVRLAYEIQ